MTEQGWVTRVRAVIADGDARVLVLEDGDGACLPFVEAEGTEVSNEFLPVIREALAGVTGVETIMTPGLRCGMSPVSSSTRRAQRSR